MSVAATLPKPVELKQVQKADDHAPTKAYTVGSYLSARLSQIGLKHHFAVAGDFNLVLLDQLLTNKDLQQVYCCNELNCGYSAEGYARACGAAAAVVTFSVGGLSAINAIAGAYAENLPVILVSGAPNSNDRATEHLIHHTLATHDWSYQWEIAKKITCAAVVITSAADAPHQIDHAIRSALREKKPAYIEIACNIAAAPCAAPGPVSAVVAEVLSDGETLEAAIAAAAKFLNGKQKPVLMIGSKLRAAGAEKQAIELADALGCAVTVMAAAKSFFRKIISSSPASTGVRSVLQAPAKSSIGQTRSSALARSSTTTRLSVGQRCRVAVAYLRQIRTGFVSTGMISVESICATSFRVLPARCRGVTRHWWNISVSALSHSPNAMPSPKRS
jgi:hypothetical protein